MIEYKIASEEEIGLMVNIRLEMLKEVNNLDDKYQYTEELFSDSREYFLHGNQTTVLALNRDNIVGCASVCYVKIMPTFSHPTGKRAHLMNVYVSKDYRRRGIAEKMVSMLISDAWDKGATEISLDATEAGRPLYKKFGFIDSSECMTLTKESILPDLS